MAWIVQEAKTQKQLAEQFKALIARSSILQIPGAHDAMAGLMAKKVGFEALYLSGAAYTASRGLPDLGMIYSNEIAQRASDIIRATNLPMLVDIDTGFGGVLNVARTACEMVEAGVAAAQLEDQNLPKKCGHLNGKTLISIEEMIQKIKTIKQLAPTLVIIARTDARSVESLEQAILRAKAYVAAGADAIFPEALQTDKEFKQFANELDAPLLANMTEFGQTPYYTAKEFEKMGYSMVIYPVTSMRVAAKAYERVFELIKNTGTQQEAVEDMQTRSELYETISYYQFEDLDRELAKTILPKEEIK
ncbi:methylisocitrate lyase [Lysinibacillus fusiformis]|uniref:methylisocitrate lyase n=1 Tax=Lysinibacillus fusiformis TaxID=28031 RepID=UPI00263B9B1A|nr:methylisocitrate lyase [Lysinibacillus fusiformis]MDC6266880.1 methylisocitrate lyase [Lysinibacillus sphaericus]MDN4968860.1 methylisocitrate lyase [Lysinibacillus fusiformis]